jgi:hypothetical protein
VAAGVVAVAVVAAVVVVAINQRDRVGLGWRGALAGGIFANLDQIDIVEIIADDYFRASAKQLRALRTLATALPVTLHGVAMGLASTEPVALRRVESMARLVDALQPLSWSEHLAFVRAGGIEIGHLAAPPRTAQSVAGTIANIAFATAIVGSAPLMENIATLIAPPASTMDEADWITGIMDGCDGRLLLDLHNLYANAVNFGLDPAALLLRLPLHRVNAVHLSGGHWIVEPGNVAHAGNVANANHGSGPMRLLDDHVHDVPPEVFSLLALLAQHAPQALTVILERDGDYPAFGVLLAQLQAARQALQCGRALALQAAA